MYKEFLQIVGNGKPTGSVLKETIVVSVTMSINVQKRHSRIRLRILSCSRMKEKRREPEVPWPCKDYLKGTCTNSFCEKWHPPECLIYKTKSGCRFEEKLSYAHRQVDEQPSKRSKKNDDKSAVAMLKKYELHDRTGKPVVGRDTRHESGASQTRSSDDSKSFNVEDKTAHDRTGRTPVVGQVTSQEPPKHVPLMNAQTSTLETKQIMIELGNPLSAVTQVTSQVTSNQC